LIRCKIAEELKMLREKQQILSGLQQACREVKMQQNGELSEQSLNEFLNELPDTVFKIKHEQSKPDIHNCSDLSDESDRSDESGRCKL
jgi:hypothetical protein